ncbi:MAG: AraC family transcriptional regulator [Erysipelotrichaceae bacterium]|nr:AraC family transcriptional regulator [Erysipelotrichaceae bacterium]
MAEIFYEVIRDYSANIHHEVGINNAILHFHHQLELLYIEEGNVTVTINDDTKVLTKGQVAIVDSFDNHQYIHEENAISRCLIIPVSYLKRYTTFMASKSIKNHFITDEAFAQRIYEKMINVVNSLKANELILVGNVSLLLGTIIDNNVVANSDKTNYDLVKNILLYIEENYKSSITLDSIANHFGYSKYYFSHIFNKCFRCNLNDYLNLVRCRHSINCVKDEHMSVSDAAFTSGFVSMRTFYRTFKKYFNVTPKEYFHKNKKK